MISELVLIPIGLLAVGGWVAYYVADKHWGEALKHWGIALRIADEFECRYKELEASINSKEQTKEKHNTGAKIENE